MSGGSRGIFLIFALAAFFVFFGNALSLAWGVEPAEDMIFSQQPGQDPPPLDNAYRSSAKASSSSGKSRSSKASTSYHSVELQPLDKVMVRRLQPLPAYDDQGKPRKRTSAELAEAKGADKKLPGYPASYEELKAGQTVQVALVREKNPSTKSNANNTKADQPITIIWVPAGEIVGIVGKIKNSAKNIQLKVDTPMLGKLGKTSASGKKTIVVDDQRISRIMILSEGDSAK
jgi:hypothetical protein